MKQNTNRHGNFRMFNTLIVYLFLINYRSGNDSSEEFFDFDENDLEELLEDKYELY